MPKVPAFAQAFAGRWRIVEMDAWDNAFLDLVEEAHITFTGASHGKIVCGALQGFLDVRYGSRDGSACGRVLMGGPGRQRSRLWAQVGQLGNRRTPCRSLLHPPRR